MECVRRMLMSGVVDGLRETYLQEQKGLGKYTYDPSMTHDNVQSSPIETYVLRSPLTVHPKPSINSRHGRQIAEGSGIELRCCGGQLQSLPPKII